MTARLPFRAAGEPSPALMPGAEKRAGAPGRPLRVAVDAVAAAPGGGMSYLRSQLPELERHGASLLVFARPAVAAALRGALGSPGSVVRVVAGGSRVAGLRFIHARLAAEARRWGADVLYCPGSAAPLRSRGIPTVVCVQNPHLFGADAPRSLALGIARPVAWLSALRATELVHISASTAADFSRHSALRRSYSIVLSGLGQAERVPPPAASARRDAIVVVSNLYAYKRVDEVIAAFAGERGLRDGYELVIAGGELEAGLRRRLADLASALGCAGRVHFTGFLAETQLLALYGRAAALVSTSRKEAFPLPPGEALAMGVPVVLSDIPPHRELYGRWARLVTPGDTGVLGREMLAAVRQGGVPRDQVEALKAAFSWARNGEALARILAQAAATGPAPARRRLQAVQPGALPRAVRAVIGRAERAGPGLPLPGDREPAQPFPGDREPAERSGRGRPGCW